MRSTVIFCWSGFPQYAARCIGAFVAAHPDVETRVWATRPLVPVEGMETLAACSVTWVEADEVLPLPDRPQETTVFATGWHVPAFMRLCSAVRKRGGRAILMCDHNYVRPQDLKEVLMDWARTWRFRLLKRKRFDGFMVPGESGRILLRRWGVPESLIAKGMYSADGSIFHDGAPLSLRPMRMMFVGQFCERKNVTRLVRAFRQAKADGWELHLFGSGTLNVQAGEGIVVHPFVQPEALAEEYRQARVFCLPSVEEHWGLVVHEAALSGCLLALSDRVGAAADFLGSGNGMVFDPYDVSDMKRTMERTMCLTHEERAAAQAESCKLAGSVGLATFAESVWRMCRASR